MPWLMVEPCLWFGERAYGQELDTVALLSIHYGSDSAPNDVKSGRWQRSHPEYFGFTFVSGNWQHVVHLFYKLWWRTWKKHFAVISDALMSIINHAVADIQISQFWLTFAFLTQSKTWLQNRTTPNIKCNWWHTQIFKETMLCYSLNP